MAKKAKRLIAQQPKKQKPLIAKEPGLKTQEDGVPRTKIRIIGIGGGGGNIVSEIAKLVKKVDFVAANTDLQAQKTLSKNVRSFPFGEALTHGLGCGMDALVGEQAAKVERERIKKLMEGQDICILVAALGGGTGSGAAPVFAELAREAKSITIGIFALPFSFEGEKRKQLADAALEKLKPFLNAHVLIPNENIFRIIDTKTPLKESLSACNQKLAETLEGFIETLSLPGLINIDFADVRSLLEGRGRLAYVNSSVGTGAVRAQQALKDVLVNPLCDYGVKGADRILFNVTGDKGLKMQEVAEISRVVTGNNPRAKIMFGISFQPEFKDKLRISIFAVGCKEERGFLAKSPQKEKEPVKKAPKPPVHKAEKKAQPKRKQQKPKKVLAKTVQVALPLASSVTPLESPAIRRNALDVKKAMDQEMEDLEKKEKEWDIPSFLRNKPNT